jgi:adenylate kinase family enzyme
MENNSKSNLTEKKMKNRTLLFISASILTLLIIVGFIFLVFFGDFFETEKDSTQDEQLLVQEEEIEPEYELMEREDGEEVWVYQKTTEEGLDGELLRGDLILDTFPQDIPISGGIVKSSSRDELTVNIELDIDATVQEALDWYEEKLVEEGWEITVNEFEQGGEGWDTGYINFRKVNDDRRGTINIDTNTYKQIITLIITELLY